jgi:magnesium-transporting ATPase (P-type)
LNCHSVVCCRVSPLQKAQVIFVMEDISMWCLYWVLFSFLFCCSCYAWYQCQVLECCIIRKYYVFSVLGNKYCNGYGILTIEKLTWLATLELSSWFVNPSLLT